MGGCDFHQAARHIDGVTYRCNLLMMISSQARSNDRPVMGPDFEAEERSNMRRQRVEPGLCTRAEADASLNRMAGILGAWFQKSEDDHCAVAHEVTDHPLTLSSLITDKGVKASDDLPRLIWA